METKFCHGCNQNLPVDNFHPHIKRGYQTRCKQCMSEMQKEYMKQPGIRERRTKQGLEWYHRNGVHRPMSEAKDCSQYLGIHVAERALSKFFDHIERMPYGNPGYDFICGKGFKIDVKSSCRHKQLGKSDKWIYVINKNQIADYFLCIGFDNRASLNPEHVWLIPSDRINMRIGIGISDNPKVYKKWSIYEKPLDRVLSCCATMRAED